MRTVLNKLWIVLGAAPETNYYHDQPNIYEVNNVDYVINKEQPRCWYVQDVSARIASWRPSRRVADAARRQIAVIGHFDRDDLKISRRRDNVAGGDVISATELVDLDFRRIVFR